jgi:hypothetical protein
MRRRLLRAVVPVALVALTACIGGGGDGDEAAVIQPEAQVTPTTAPPTTAPSGDQETFEFISDKNPFTPLAGPGTGGTGTGGTPTTSPTGGTGTGGTPTTSPTGGTGDVEPEVAQRVALLDVFSEGGEVKANVRVNTTVHTVGVGDTFADRYKVLSLSLADECGRFLFGDDAFRLCRGQQVTK